MSGGEEQIWRIAVGYPCDVLLTLLFVGLFFFVGFMSFVCLLISFVRRLFSGLLAMGLFFLVGFVSFVCLLISLVRRLLSGLGAMGLFFLISLMRLLVRLVSRCLMTVFLLVGL